MAGLVPWGEIESASDLTTGAVIDRPASRAQSAVDNRIGVAVPPLVAQAIADDDTVAQAAADAVSVALVGASVLPVRRLTAADSLIFDNLETGVYQITLSAVAVALGLPEAGNYRGVLTVQRWTTSAGKVGQAVYQTSREPTRTWSYRWARSDEPASQGWVSVDAQFATMNDVNAATANVRRVIRLVHSLETPVDFFALDNHDYIVNRSIEYAALGLPVNMPGVLRVNRWDTSGGRPGLATYETTAEPARTWSYTFPGVGPSQTGWLEVTAQSSPGGSRGEDFAIRHAHIRDRHAARIGAPLSATGTPIAFVWDDYPAPMRDKGVVALAALHEIPITFAVCSRTLDPGYEHLVGGNGVASWAEIDSWVAGGWVELANHGATHDAGLGTAQMWDEIVNGLNELRSHSPSGEIDTWVMSTNNWENFNSGPDADSWATHAGQLILGHHAYATGKDPVLSDRTQPMTGTPIQGQDRVWVESVGMTMAQRKTLITKLYGTSKGTIISAHANWIDQPDRWTAAEVEEFFEWLAGERDAGRITPMFLSRWAWVKK